METLNNTTMNFGKWIVVAFILFAGFIFTLVTVCMRQDVPLVTKEYYKEELAFQNQIERERNTESLIDKPVISIKEEKLEVSYNQLPVVEHAQLKLFRPSDPALDQQFQLTSSTETMQSFRIEHAQRGLYRARLTWEQEGKEYFMEQVVVL